MIASVTNYIWRIISMTWLTGPIFDKELRVSSRRRRNYFIRSLYVLLLTVFVAFIWAEEVQYRGSNSLFTASRMAEAGRTIIMFIVWFQFVAAQIVAGVMLSTAISDEIYNRTLGVLMTTPISSFQIVTGKLLSRLLQTIILLAITLPLLAVIRVFGGVPWDYLLAGLAMTLTTALLAGSVSMFFSIFSKRAYVVIIFTVLTFGLVFFVLPMMWGFLHNAITGDWPGPRLTVAIFTPNPYAAMAVVTEDILSARMGGSMPGYSWILHCAVSLAASAVLLSLSVLLVRKVALAQVSGQTFSLFRRRRRKITKKVSHSRRTVSHIIRPVTGNPVHWKERLLPLFGKSRLLSRILFAVGMVILALTYIPVSFAENFDNQGVQFVYCFILYAIGAIFTLVLPATVITSEKESRAWPLLLQTTLTDSQIITGKVLAVLRRCAIFWIPLFAHVLLFTILGCINPFALIMLPLSVIGAVLFVTGSGLMFSAWFKRTTTAVIVNFCFAVIVWGLIPFLLALCFLPTGIGDDIFEAYADVIPVAHLAVIIDAAVPAQSNRINWPGHRNIGVAGSIAWLFFCMVVYAGLGFGMAHIAKTLFRRRTFHNT
jgi:ABC-type transport system involved in multi-copper enzyme maturation permease subunit